jgi:5-(aminomethyl)-3-furanmethanol phosphate kinase
MSSQHVIKVGGSLFDIPNLGARVREWLDAESIRQPLLVAGGGNAANMVREADNLDRLGEERCHWLALRALTFTAHLLAGRLDGAEVISDPGDRDRVWSAGKIPVLDMLAFAVADETRPGHLPHRWEYTSDSLAVRVALVAQIPNLILLKSRSMEPIGDWQAAAADGLVDRAFPGVAAAAAEALRLSAVNFRRWLVVRASEAIPPGP